jgi:hypothetical protein
MSRIKPAETKLITANSAIPRRTPRLSQLTSRAFGLTRTSDSRASSPNSV